MKRKRVFFVRNRKTNTRKMVWFGLVWLGLVWFGLVWFGLVRLDTSKRISNS